MKNMGGKKLTTAEVIAKATLVHHDKYNYSLVEYVNSRTKIKIICLIHGIFEQHFNNHLNGHGCKKCGSKGSKPLSINEFIEKAKIKHNNKYDYSLVEYNHSLIKVKIKCPIHGIFEQIPSSHLRGRGCSKCSKRKLLSIDEFIKKAKIKHNNKYDYSLVKYNDCKSKIKIKCPIHGIFEQNPNTHLYGSGCYKCYHENNKGVNNPSWNPNLTKEDRIKRRLGFPELRLWKISIYERDNYICQKCKIRGYNLQAHHIHPWHSHENLRFDINNGLTLCQSCHQNYHSMYGKDQNCNEITLNQFLKCCENWEQFMKDNPEFEALKLL
jgi:5-methylcytosine-specific restriction endonuclease McrA